MAVEIRPLGQQVVVRDKHVDATGWADRGCVPPPYFSGLDDAAGRTGAAIRVICKGHNGNLAVIRTNLRPLAARKPGSSPRGIDDDGHRKTPDRAVGDN